MSPTLTKNETKILETAVKIAGKFGKDEDKKRNLRSVMSIAEKFKKSVGEPRESLLKDIKSHNRKKSLVAVSKSINNMLAIYNIKKKEAQGESKKEIEIEPSGETKVLSNEKKKRIRGRKVLPTPKPPAKLETMPSTPTKEMEAPKIKKEEPPIKAPDSIPEDEEVKVEEEANVEEEEAKVEEEEAKVEEEEAKVEEDSDQSIPEPKVEEEPIKRKVEEVKGDDMTLDPNINPPSKQMGKRLEDLTVEEINKDLDYFYKNFGNRLRKIKRSKSKNLKVLQRFYKRVLAALRTEPPKDKKEIGVIIKGSDFIKDALKEIILENSIDGLSAQDLLINIEGQEDTQKSDAGQYEFKKGPNSGKVYAEGEPISRLIPTTEPEQVSEMNPKRKQKINRIPNPKTRYSGLETTAKKMVASNPFLKSNQPTIKLKTLY